MPGKHHTPRHRMMHEWQMDEQKEGRGGYKSTALLPSPGAGSTQTPHGSAVLEKLKQGNSRQKTHGEVTPRHPKPDPELQVTMTQGTKVTKARSSCLEMSKPPQGPPHRGCPQI